MEYQQLQLFRPCISKNITQRFGENRACVDANGKVYGVPSGRTCPNLSVYQRMGMFGHNGVDIAGLKGSDIYHCATFPGWWKLEKDAAGGIGVDVVSNEPLFFPGPPPLEIKATARLVTQNGVSGFVHYVKMRYWHLSLPVGHDGKQVTVGTVIGLMGNTGVSSGVHLHYAPKWCDADGKGIGQGNGYFGAFDPLPYSIFRVTALEHSEMVVREATPLSDDEKQEIKRQLSLVQQVLIALQKIINKV